MTHAFFKALLFLGAGSVIIAMHHEQDMRYMGGLRRYMPITWITMWVGTLALTGMPGFAGFFSKDAIIEAVHDSHLGLPSTYAYWCVLLGVLVTALYSFRLLYLTFHGSERFVVEHGGHGHDDHDHHEPGHLEHPPLESPWVVTVPLILLAIPSIIIGAATVGAVLHGDYFGASLVAEHTSEPGEFAGWTHLMLEGFTRAPFMLAFLGFATATYVYLFNPSVADKAQSALRPLWIVLDRKYWFDPIYQAVFARGSVLLGRGLWKGGDVGVIDNVLIDGTSAGVGRIAATVRWVQSGYLYTYAFAMILGLVALLGGLWYVVR
jgi:NADH-quinone oxidoreductase subunit L